MSPGMNKSVFIIKAYASDSNVSMEKNYWNSLSMPSSSISPSTLYFITYFNTTPQIAFDCSFPLYWPSAKSTGIEHHRRKWGSHLVRIMCELGQDCSNLEFWAIQQNSVCESSDQFHKTNTKHKEYNTLKTSAKYTDLCPESCQMLNFCWILFSNIISLDSCQCNYGLY